MSEKIGQILVRRKIITEFDLNAAMERKAREPKKYLGQILCEMGLPQSKIIKGIYSPLGAMLVDNRTISAENYIHALSAHFSMPIVSLKDFTVLPALQHVIGEQYALRNRIVVVRTSPQKVTVAVAEPNLSIFENLEKAIPKGKYILFCLAKTSEIENCLDKKYDPYSYLRIKF